MTRRIAWIAALVACGGDGPGKGKDSGDAACDADADGALAQACGGDDCDDGMSDVFPGAVDLGLRTDEPGLKGGTLAAVRGADGVLRVAKGGNDGLHYAQLGSSGWEVEQVDVAYMYFTSLVVDADGAPHIFYGGAFEGAYHAVRTGSGWQIEQLAAERIDGDTASAVGPDGALHVAWQDYFADVPVYATNASGSWVVEQVPVSGGIGVSLAVDGDSVLLAHGASPKGLHLGVRSGGSWTDEVVAYEFAYGTRVAADGARIAFTDGASIRVAERASGAWTLRDVAPHGARVLALDAAGTVDWAAFSNGVARLGRDGETAVIDRSASVGDAALVRDGDVVDLFHYDLPEGFVRRVTWGWPDGIDQDCDGWTDARPGSGDTCEWAVQTVAGDECALAVSEEHCEDRLAMCPTPEDFVACQMAIGAGQCDGDALPAGCDGCRSGLDPAASASSLAGSDWTALCTWSAAVAGGAGRAFECSDGTTTVNTVAECEEGAPAFAACGIAVGAIEDCMIAVAVDPCDALMVADACAPVRGCFGF